MVKEWVFGLAELDTICGELINHLQRDSKVFLTGDMGAGKTTLIKSLVKNLGSQDQVSSPTYSIINDYFNPENGQIIHHMDLYRLNRLEEALDIGVEDYLEDNTLCLIEWPEIIDSLANEKTIRLNLSILPDNQRKMIFL